MGRSDNEFDDLALLLLYLASWEEKGAAARRAWKGISFETLDALSRQGYLTGSRGAKSVWLTAEGIAACPPEDCGGIGGYATFLAAMANPRHERHVEYREWIGDDFDPEAFDLDAVNRALAGGGRRPPKP